MNLDALREQIPDYAKDISLNLGTLAGETTLDTQQLQGCFLAAAHASGVPAVVKAIESAAEGLSPEARSAAKSAAAIMGMNNV